MTNLCTDCGQIPAVPGISLCFECMEDARAEIDSIRTVPPYTGDICCACGSLLTVTDEASSHPRHCAKCRDEIWRNEFNDQPPPHLPRSLEEWLKTTDAKEICGGLK